MWPSQECWQKLIPEYYVNIPWSCGYDLHSRSSLSTSNFHLGTVNCFHFPPSDLGAGGIVVINYGGTELKMVCRLSKKLSAVSLKSGGWCVKQLPHPRHVPYVSNEQLLLTLPFCLERESGWIYWINNHSIMCVLFSCDREIWL